jgi:hypothetical protein
MTSTIGGINERLSGLEPDGSLTRAVHNLTEVEIVANGDGGDPPPPTKHIIRTVPQIVAFLVQPGTIMQGDEAVIRYEVLGASRIEISTSDEELLDSPLLAGTLTVTPHETTNYEIVAFAELRGKDDLIARAIAQIEVITVQPRIEEFEVVPASILEGETARLDWSVDIADRITISAGSVPLYDGNERSGSLEVMPSETTFYELTAKNGSAMSAASATLRVLRPPRILGFTAMPERIALTESSTLSWSVLGADLIEISVRGATATISTSLMSHFVVAPTVTSTYTLSASNADGERTADVVVVVE